MIIVIIIKTSYPSSETLWVHVFGRAVEELGGPCLCTEAGGLLPQGEHSGCKVHICLRTFSSSWACRRSWRWCWKPYRGFFPYREITLGREGDCWWHTNQTGKGGCQCSYIHWKHLCHKLTWAELKPKRRKSPKSITIRPSRAPSSDSSLPCRRSVKCGFTSSLGVILWQHSQLLQTCEGKYSLPQITFLEVMAQQSEWNHQTPRWAKAKAIDPRRSFWPTG